MSDFIWLGFASLFIFACNITENLGVPAVSLKRHITIPFLVVASLILVSKVAHRADCRKILRIAFSHLPAFLLFLVLIGAGGMASHGVAYAAMANNFWDFSAVSPLARRVVLPGLAHMLGIDQDGYAWFWYAVVFVAFCQASEFLRCRNIDRLEGFSLLTSSIFARLLIIPGYSDVLIIVCSLYCIGRTLSRPEKIALAALMLGAHEVMSLFVMLPIILRSDAQERSELVVIWVSLLIAYMVGYSINWHFNFYTALSFGLKASPGETISSFQWLVKDPGWALLAIAASYKLNWLIVLRSLKFSAPVSRRLMAACVIVTLPLMLIATDASRLIQFSSIAFLFLAVEILPTWSRLKRRWLAIVNLMVPSIYVGTNCGPIWGKGLYSIFLFIGRAIGMNWGGVVI